MSALSQVQVRRFTAGQAIFQEGDDAHNEAFLIQSGKVAIRKIVGGEERILRVLGEGELLGHVSLFRAGPRTAAALAETDVALCVIPGDRLEHFIRTNPKLAVEIVKGLAALLVEAEERGRK
jgi:CRP/FNR family transcriptional regulator, cyclic AMP receptor protein